MQEIPKNDLSILYDHNIDLYEILGVLWQKKWITISFTTLFSVMAVVYSLSLPDIYESKALLTPINSSSNISSNLQSYSGLAGLAGIRIPSSRDQSNSTLAIKKLSSLSFFENYILPNIFLPDLMALESWDSNTNKLNYDEKLYDISSNAWKSTKISSKKYSPSAQQSFQKFISQHFKLTEDKSTGFVTLAIKHQSPSIAKQWLELIVHQINLLYRDKDKLSSNTAVNYLNKQITATSLTEIKQAISQLLNEETKKLALIEANQNYVFDYIDPPALMEKKSEPNRSLICILSALLGGILSIIFVLIRYVFSKRDS